MKIPGVVVIALILSTTGLRAQVLDRVVAVVGDDLILESEFNAQVQFYVFNNKIDPSTPGLREQVLQSMISEKLIVAKAIEDSVVVTDDEVQQQLQEVIKQRIQQVGSEARLEELYGMPLSRIKRDFRDEMRKNLLATRLQQQKFGDATISRREVEEFFNTYKDSLGIVPEEVEIAHIYITPKFDERAKTVARAKLQELLDSLKMGVDFGDLARRHSEDPGSAKQGGELGLVRRGQFVKEFETAVFSLKEGEVSGIVETQFGFHIVQLLERRGDAVIARHILLRVSRTPASDSVAIALLDSLRIRALPAGGGEMSDLQRALNLTGTAGESFAELAKKYSEDKQTALIGGSLGTLDLESQVEKEFYPTIVGLQEGEIGKPSRIGDGYHIVYMKRRIPAHPVSLEQDYHRLEALALNFKRSKEYTSWIEDLKKNIYWEERL
ncbi:MAG: peptidylprolyl isomerase [Ignavibacteria bacterium]|nr:peptidylprolyl isomerase [Ignavibacteria bacterium]